MEKSFCNPSASSEYALQVEGLSKSFGQIHALDHVSFDVRKGELFGLIGPDGAGKTTLFRLLTTLLLPDAGTATVNGYDINEHVTEIRSSVGYMPGRFSLYPDLTVEENLRFFAAAFGVTVEENYHLIAPVFRKLEPFRTRRAGKLSGGMKQKLALSCALIHKPDVLLLDEPTTGVDAVSRTEFWNMLLSIKAMGISLLVSTPYMDEASLCDRVALVNKGKVLSMDTPGGIVAKEKMVLYAVSADEMFRLLGSVRKEKGVEMCYPFGSVHHLVVNDSFNPGHLQHRLMEEQFRDIRLEETPATIEDVFIKLMQ